jgi:hypothetical protein
MNEETVQRIAALEQKVARLEALLTKEVARIDKTVTDLDGGCDEYITRHRNEHNELSKMIWPAYAKTHPEYVVTLLKCDEILGKGSDDGNDPQP